MGKLMLVVAMVAGSALFAAEEKGKPTLGEVVLEMTELDAAKKLGVDAKYTDGSHILNIEVVGGNLTVTAVPTKVSKDDLVKFNKESSLVGEDGKAKVRRIPLFDEELSIRRLAQYDGFRSRLSASMACREEADASRCSGDRLESNGALFPRNLIYTCYGLNCRVGRRID